ncbi:MAG: JAB domain-containing protein [Nitrospira sp.]|nr:JAB domain-containing protein [Nitrospira sp.]
MPQTLKQQTVKAKRRSEQPELALAYQAPRYRVTLVCEEGGEEYVIVHNSTAAASLLRPHLSGLDREHFLVIGLDAKNRVIGINLVAVGSLTMAIVHPREVFKPLILMNAAGWICAHNHPSGDVTPSQEDRVLTKRLREAGQLLGLNLLDHLILADENLYSFADQGWPI